MGGIGTEGGIQRGAGRGLEAGDPKLAGSKRKLAKFITFCNILQ